MHREINCNNLVLRVERIIFQHNYIEVVYSIVYDKGHFRYPAIVIVSEKNLNTKKNKIHDKTVTI